MRPCRWTVVSVVWLLWMALVTVSQAANTHGLADSQQEMQAVLGDLHTPYVVSGCAPSVPSSSLTFGAFACKGYVTVSGRLVYVDQSSAGVGPLNVGNGTYWLALHVDRTIAVGGWTRQAGTHYLWQLNATQPVDVSGYLVFRQVTVEGGVITTSTPAASGSPGLPRYTFAGLPAPGFPGRQVRVIDTVRGIWIDTGTQWVRQDPIIDLVRDFDMKFDNATDEAALLNTALSAANASTQYKTVRASRIGTAILGSAITLYSGLTLECPQGPQTWFKQKANTQVNDSLFTGTSITNITILGCGFDGNYANQGAILRRLVLVGCTTCTDVKIDRVEMKNAYGLGGSIGILLGIGGSSNRATVTNSYFHDTGTLTTEASDCLYFSGNEANIQFNRFSNCTDTGVASDAISTDGANPSDHMLVANNTFRGNAQAIQIVASILNTVSEGHLIANNLVLGGNAANNAAVVFADLGTGTSLEEVTMANNIVRRTTAGNGFRVRSADHVSVIGNRARAIDTNVASFLAFDGIHQLWVGNSAQSGGGAGFGVAGMVNGLLLGNIAVANGADSGAPTGFDARNSSTPLSSNSLAFIGNLGSSSPQTRCIQTADSIANVFVATNVCHNSPSDGFNLTATGTPGARRFANWQHTVTTFPGNAEDFDDVLLKSHTFAELGAGTNGTLTYCSDCTVASPCAGGGGGAFAKRLGGSWICN